MAGNNIGNLLNERNVTWGWFIGGFDLNVKNKNGTTGCKRSSVSPRLPARWLPTTFPTISRFSTTLRRRIQRMPAPRQFKRLGISGDAANHQYDVHDFYDAVKAGNFPAVSFLKARAFQDGHAGYSNPLDEQTFLVQVTNFLQRTPEWKDTAVIIAYDDSDGWYDHQMSPIVNQSTGSRDALVRARQLRRRPERVARC